MNRLFFIDRFFAFQSIFMVLFLLLLFIEDCSLVARHLRVVFSKIRTTAFGNKLVRFSDAKFFFYFKITQANFGSIVTELP